jgi:hypothetical protein
MNRAIVHNFYIYLYQENPNSGSLETSPTEEKEAPSSDSLNAMEDKVTPAPSQPSKKPNELDKLISQLQTEIDVTKQEGEKQNGYEEAHESYYDEEYDQSHNEPQDVYPDQDASQTAQDEENNEKEDKSHKHIKTKQEDFDYGRYFPSKGT